MESTTFSLREYGVQEHGGEIRYGCEDGASGCCRSQETTKLKLTKSSSHMS